MSKFAVHARINPEKRRDFLLALREYLPAVSAEQSTLQYDVCQSEADPNVFLFFEAYRDDAAAEAHQNSTAFRTYIEKIGPYMESPPVVMKLVESAK